MRDQAGDRGEPTPSSNGAVRGILALTILEEIMAIRRNAMAALLTDSSSAVAEGSPDISKPR